MDPKRSSVLAFITLVFAFSTPFWLLGNVYKLELLPGLPISSLAAFTPGIAAVVLVYRNNQLSAVSRLLHRAFDFDRIRVRKWYFVFVLFNPVVAIIAYGVLRSLGIEVPAPSLPKLFVVVLMSLSFFVAALGEEIGWTGYATERLLRRWGLIPTGLSLGLVWAVFHFILLAQANHSLDWIAWWSLGTLILRTVMVWLYSRAGSSVFAAAVFHTMINLSWQLFPIHGSYYDPRVFSIVLLALAILLAAARQLGPRAGKPVA